MSATLSLPKRLANLLQIRPGEGRAVVWSCLYIFCVLFAYYVIRPIRDNMGIAGGVNNLQWLFTGTLVCMLLCNLPFAALSRHLPRVSFISITYRFFIANLLVFAVLLTLGSPTQEIWIGRVFFVWVSVFNLFVVSVFWALIVDVFDADQGARLFAILAAGATIGAIVGSSVTALLAHAVGQVGLLFISAVLLEIAVLCVRRLSALAPQHRVHATTLASSEVPPNPLTGEPVENTIDEEVADDPAHAARRPEGENVAAQPLGGTWLGGITGTLRSPYLANICLYMLLFAVATTILYFEQASLVHRYFSSSSARVTFFATLDLVGNVLTLAMQLSMTSRIIRTMGVALAIALIPALSVAGFALLAVWPGITVLVGFAVLRRAGNFAIARPTREILFTSVSREDKYKAKSFIDTVIYRLGDQVGAWTYAGFESIRLSPAGMAWVAVVLSIAWFVNSYWLGRRQEAMATAKETT